MSDGFDRFPLHRPPAVLVPDFVLPEFCPGMTPSRLATYIAVRSFTWRKSAATPDRATALTMVVERFGQAPATVERNLAWLEGQYLLPHDVLTFIRARGQDGDGGDGR